MSASVIMLSIISGLDPNIAFTFAPTIVDHTRHFRHALAHLCVVANVCGFACSYAAVCLLRRLWFA